MNQLPARLADVIGRFLGKVEIVLAGADDDLRAGQEALAGGDPMGARAAAHRVLEQAPGAPLALALLADACETAHLDAELALTLEELARRAPGRAEVWLRLARAREATGAPADDVSDAFARALSAADSGSDERLDALLGLADLDLARGDGARAELWLVRASPAPRVAASPAGPGAGRAAEIAVRAAEARMLRGDAAGAKARLEGIAAAPTDGRAALVGGRARAALGDPGAFAPLVRAMVLDTPGASEALASALAHLPSDAQTRTRARSVVDAKGEQGLARWRAAFARAEGARDAARSALRDALAAGDAAAARPLLDAAIDDRDAGALRAALDAIPPDDSDPLARDARRLAGAIPPAADGHGAALDALAATTHPRLIPWVEALAADVAAAWIPSAVPSPGGAPSSAGTTAAWPALLARLDARAHEVGDLATAARVGDLAAERSRPVRLAVLGEFNAGKSTLINALIGADVAPTGVLPTTATLHHLRWAPDPFAKLLFEEGVDPPERIVPIGDLRAALATLDPTTIRRVELRMPLASLVSVEILDTPGFNAPEPRHSRVARAVFDEADAALWLVDATQAIKQSEREALEEAGRARVPVQILVNKADRLSPADLARVMQTVADAVPTLPIESWGPPLALSAKKALAARLGRPDGSVDAAGLAGSGWPAVQALLQERVVARCAELKERALRRRASRVVAQLADAWGERASREHAEGRRQAARAQAAAQATARLERESTDASERFAAAIQAGAHAWALDMERVFAGRDRHATRDPVVERYRIDRAVSAMAPALAQAMAAAAPETGLSQAEIAPVARAILRAAAGRAAADAQAEIDGVLSAASRAAVATLADRLAAESVAPPPPDTAAGVLRELRAFARALEPARAATDGGLH